MLFFRKKAPEKKRKSSGFFKKFALVMIFLSVIPLVFMGIRAILINRELSKNVEEISTNSLATSILDKQSRLSGWMADSIDDFFSDIIQNVGIIVDSVNMPNISRGQRDRIVASAYATTQEFVAVALFNRKKGIEYSVPPNWKFRTSEILNLSKGLEENNFRLSDVYLFSHRPLVSFIYRFSDSEYFFAVLNLERILKKLSIAPAATSEEIFIVSDRGRIILHSDKNKMETKVDISDLSLIKEFLSSKMPTSKEFLGLNGIPMIGSISPSRMTGWGIIVWQTKSTAYAPVAKVKKHIKDFTNKLIKYTYAQIFVISVVAFLAAFLMAKGISKPLLALSRAAARVARRDFSTPVSVKSKDEIGELAGIFNSMMDELKRYDQMQADKLDALVFSIRDGLIMIDEQHRIIIANEMARRIFSMPDNCVGWELSKAIENESIGSKMAELVKSQEQQKMELDMSYGDVPKFFEAVAYPVKTRDDKILGNIITVRNITLEKELARMKDDFLHSITHDLRSPMTSIRGFLEILLDETVGELNDEQKNFLRIMDESSEKLLTMINNLLDISKLEAGKMVLSLSDVDLPKMAKHLVDFFWPQAKNLKIDLSMEVAGEVRPIKADENLIERVITNLISNAIKFTPEGGSVKIIIKNNFPEKDAVCVSVSDTGRGIPADEIDKVFEKYHQVAGTASKKTGTGLGLTVCKYIIESHHGKIWAESTFGKGSTFSFWIPKDLYKDNGDIKRKRDGK
ncbi:MAG: HAMP domain-containing protein [Elusimicrobia bacterium]|nr:HAMP domain-containing protein [Elusimicrobiota bacterium]